MTAVFADEPAGEPGGVQAYDAISEIVFWDIDGTLLSTARAGIGALEDAASDVLGVQASFAELQTAGLTDAEVARLAISTCGGQPDHATITRFLGSYERALPERLHARRGGVMPGVIETLDALERRPSCLSLLLTGNTPAGARAKLSHYGLGGRFAGGGFCDRRWDRTAIAEEARDVAASMVGRPASGLSMVVVGDTPLDVACGKAIGARTVAVATGSVAAEDLAASDPWVVWERLPVADEFPSLVFDGG
ncbi:MAG: HAD family hydrolase [Solirubrobacterales bacterium]